MLFKAGFNDHYFLRTKKNELKDCKDSEISD